jgi:quercetin dioxygenase-like cupin family protein
MAIKSTELIRTSQSWDGAILPDFPQGRPELRVIRLDFPVGAKTGWHHHTVVNYGIVQQGELTIVCQDGSEKTFHEGEPLVEVIGTIHRGENRGRKPVILNMFYFSLPGQEITVQHPELEHEQKPGTSSRQTGGVASAEKGKTQRLVPKDKEEARVYKLVLALGKKILPRRQLVADVGLRQKSRCIFVYNYWKPCWERGLIDFAYASVPHKPEQAYRLTAKGLELYAQLTAALE